MWVDFLFFIFFLFKMDMQIGTTHIHQGILLATLIITSPFAKNFTAFMFEPKLRFHCVIHVQKSMFSFAKWVWKNLIPNIERVIQSTYALNQPPSGRLKLNCHSFDLAKYIKAMATKKTNVFFFFFWSRFVFSGKWTQEVKRKRITTCKQSIESDPHCPIFIVMYYYY